MADIDRIDNAIHTLAVALLATGSTFGGQTNLANQLNDIVDHFDTDLADSSEEPSPE